MLAITLMSRSILKILNLCDWTQPTSPILLFILLFTHFMLKTAWLLVVLLFSHFWASAMFLLPPGGLGLPSCVWKSYTRSPDHLHATFHRASNHTSHLHSTHQVSHDTGKILTALVTWQTPQGLLYLCPCRLVMLAIWIIPWKIWTQLSIPKTSVI